MSAAARSSAALPADALEVGRIGEPWGVKGWFRVHPHAAPAEALRAAPVWYLTPPEAPRLPPSGRAVAAPLPATLALLAVRPHGDGLVAQARGIDDRDAAAVLRGAHIHLSRAAFPPPGEDEYYLADLIGLAVRNREGVDLGRVVGFIDTGPHTVLRLASADAGADPDADGDADAERLVPFVAAYVDSVDLAAGRIVVDWGVDF